MAEASGGLPVILYDIPVRTGRRIAASTIVRLAHDVPAIVALKDAAGDPVGHGAPGGPAARRASRSTAATTS